MAVAGPLQEQPARHRVQPVRGASAGERRPGHRAVRRDRRGHRPRHPARGRAAGPRGPGRVASSTPTATRRCSTRRPTRRTMPESLQEVATRPTWTPSAGGCDLPEPSSAASRAPPSLRWAVAEMVLGANPADLHVRRGPGVRAASCTATARRSRSSSPSSIVEQQLGRHDGAHRARRRLRRRRRPHQGHPAARRHLAHRGRQALHHQRRVGHGREHHPPRARPPGASRAPAAPAPRACRCSSCPKFHFDCETGELGERNGVYVTNVEHKMGLKVSTTCELTFGERGSRPSAGSSATCTTASRRCSRSSSTPG